MNDFDDIVFFQFDRLILVFSDNPPVFFNNDNTIFQIVGCEQIINRAAVVSPLYFPAVEI